LNFHNRIGKNPPNSEFGMVRSEHWNVPLFYSGVKELSQDHVSEKETIIRWSLNTG